LTACAGNVWQTALSTNNAQQTIDITNTLASASRAALPSRNLLVIDVLTGI
jgi:hypothetical protein